MSPAERHPPKWQLKQGDVSVCGCLKDVEERETKAADYDSSSASFVLTFHRRAPSFSPPITTSLPASGQGVTFQSPLNILLYGVSAFFSPGRTCYTITRRSHFVCSLMKRSGVGPAASTLGPATMSHWGSGCQDCRRTAVKVWTLVEEWATQRGGDNSEWEKNYSQRLIDNWP